MKASPSSTLLRLSVIVLTAACASSAPRNAPDDRATVTAADIEQHPEESIESMIQRKVPGVVVSKTADGQIALYIRGATNIDGRPKPPMYVVNQLPMAPGPDGEMPVNPYDIETIKVLKGADAAIYGIDGADGVIVITLKKAKAPKPF
jgi:TonB-dependent SusC/RagA subfamily outer membrane receptor